MSISSNLDKLWSKFCFQKVDIPNVNITASGDDNGATPAANVNDFNLNTRWANQGVGSWIQLELPKVHDICSVRISWYVGETRKYHFFIKLSMAEPYYSSFSLDSSGTTADFERYPMNNIKAKYVNVIVNGSTRHDNTTSDWAAINGLMVYRKPFG